MSPIERLVAWFRRVRADRVAPGAEGASHAHEHAHADGVVHRHPHDHAHVDFDHAHTHADGEPPHTH